MDSPDGESELRALVARALAAIDDDAPDYPEPLAALAGSPRWLAQLAQQPELGRALFAELRKLRPLTLWVRDRASVALAKKSAATLDGAVCSLLPGEPVPAPEGRECWLEVDAAEAESTLRTLPRGWGLILRGDLSEVSFAALRKLSPLRALGAVVQARPRPSEPAGHGSPSSETARLDLVIVQASAPIGDLPALSAHVEGARMLWSVDHPELRQLPPPRSPSIGVLCDGNHALAYALWLATVRLPPAPPR